MPKGSCIKLLSSGMEHFHLLNMLFPALPCPQRKLFARAETAPSL
jgi:hypothetical protein